jgi:hypothetical protein
MSVDENTILSAWLDRQLDPDQQCLAESALAADARLAEELRALTMVRDLVSALPRESPVDVSSRVMERILNREPAVSELPARGSRRWRPRRVAALATWLTAAAAVMIASTLAMVHGLRVPGRAAGGREAGSPSIAANHSAPAIAPTGPGGARLDSPEQHSFQGSSRSNEASAAVSERGAHGVIGAAAAGSLPPDSDLQDVRQLLDNSNLRRFFFVRNGQDGKAEQQVASVVERTVHHGYFKMTISQGIVIDPRHPDEATVFALVVNPDELHNLRDQLKVALADQLEEGPADPRVVTQLADIEPIKLPRPPAPAAVSIPGEGLAFSTPTRGSPENNQVPIASAARGPTPEQYRSAPVPRPGFRSAVTGQRAANASEAVRPAESVVVVWIYNPRADLPSTP